MNYMDRDQDSLVRRSEPLPDPEHETPVRGFMIALLISAPLWAAILGALILF